MEKYKLSKAVLINGEKFYQVIALKDFGDIQSGDTGGYVGSESNLSQQENAWISGNARISGDARISGNARTIK